LNCAGLKKPKKAFETYLQIDNTNEKIRARLEACEKEIAATIKTNIAEDKEAEKAPSQPSGDVKNESPSPVLVEKPSPREVKEVEPLVGNEQQVGAEGKEQASEKKPADETSAAAPETAEESKGDATKSPDEGGNGSVVAKKD